MRPFLTFSELFEKYDDQFKESVANTIHTNARLPPQREWQELSHQLKEREIEKMESERRFRDLPNRPIPQVLDREDQEKFQRLKDFVEKEENEPSVWERNYGSELEPALESGAIALLDAMWLVDFAYTGQILPCRQQLPLEAFLRMGTKYGSTNWRDRLSRYEYRLSSHPY